MAKVAISGVPAPDDPTAPEEATERIWTAATPSLAKAIDDYFHENRFKTRSAAVRQLIELGLRAAAFRSKNLT